MTANTNPIFTVKPNIGVAQISTANANRDGTGTVATIFTPGIYGARVHRIKVRAQVTTTAGIIRIFIHDGANFRLYKEIPVTAITPSATVEAFEAIVNYQGEDAIILPTGYTIRASTEKAETFNIFVEGGDY